MVNCQNVTLNLLASANESPTFQALLTNLGEDLEAVSQAYRELQTSPDAHGRSWPKMERSPFVSRWFSGSLRSGWARI